METGEINSIDLLKLARYLEKLDTNLEGAYLTACNVNEDDIVNEGDLNKIVRMLCMLENLSFDIL